jgi:ketosteroid isomerase-like protein
MPSIRNFVLIFLLLPGCGNQAVEPIPGGVAKLQVENTERAFARAFAMRDLASFEQFLAKDAVFLSGGNRLHGKQGILDVWAPLVRSEEAPFSWTPDSIEMLASGDLALSTGLVRDPAGAVTGRFVSIWRRETSGDWKIIADRGEFDPAACPEPVQDVPEVEVDPEATLEK